MSGELQKDDSDDDEGDAGNAHEGRGFSENDDPDERGAHRSDPGPDRVGRPERKRLHPLREDDEAQNRKQPSTKVEGFATIAETTSHQACLRPAPESPAGNPDPADFDLH